MTSPRPNLVYLFNVQYKDGSTYSQNPGDVSIFDDTKSCFADVDLPNVHHFTLSDDSSYFSVDLETGDMTSSEEWGNIKGSGVVNVTKRELIYFRRVTVDLNVFTGEELNSTVEYHIGWKSKNPDGKDCEFKLTIAT